MTKERPCKTMQLPAATDAHFFGTGLHLASISLLREVLLAVTLTPAVRRIQSPTLEKSQ